MSDFDVSPLGVPTALLRDEVRVAFLGRTSTEDQQDPRQSLIRQLRNCKTAIPESWIVIAHYFDVESGRMELAARGCGERYERFDIPIPRDGGIADLLEEATHPDRGFDVVICENIARVARRAFEGLTVERALERVEVPLFAANEPITLGGSRAQRILQRRINQSLAEYEVLNTLEQSWGGLCAHVRDGYNIGKPCHGYKAKTIRHPNPSKAAKGLTKSRLAPDGLRGETVTQIALWRYYEKLGGDTIADRLNADLTKYPPPVPPGKNRARGAWSRTSVYEILRNPKYTGYQVFNRRASRSRGGKVNDPIKWVWSPEPVHEPLIPKWMYDEINAHRDTKRGSRDGDSANKHPLTARTNLFRSRIICGCGRRMYGCVRNKASYYLCQIRNNNRGHPDKYADHQKALYVREDAILDAVTKFFADRVFGRDRRAILAADLSGVDDRAAQDRQNERERLQRQLDDIAQRQKSLLAQAQQGDPNDPFTKALRGSYNELEGSKSEALASIAELDEADKAEQRPLDATDIDLLDSLPYLALNLAQAPQTLLGTLFDITQLRVELNHSGDEATITIRLPADQLSEVAISAERITDAMPTQNVPAQRAADTCVDAVRAPGEIRTHTGRVLNPLPLPVGLRGRRGVNFTGSRERRFRRARECDDYLTW